MEHTGMQACPDDLTQPDTMIIPVKRARFQPALDNAGVLYGLLLAIEEIGIPPVEDEDRIFALMTLISEAKGQARLLVNSLETIRD